MAFNLMIGWKVVCLDHFEVRQFSGVSAQQRPPSEDNSNTEKPINHSEISSCQNHPLDEAYAPVENLALLGRCLG